MLSASARESRQEENRKGNEANSQPDRSRKESAGERISKVHHVGGSRGAGTNANFHIAPGKIEPLKNNDTNKKVKRSLRAPLVS